MRRFGFLLLGLLAVGVGVHDLLNQFSRLEGQTSASSQLSGETGVVAVEPHRNIRSAEAPVIAGSKNYDALSLANQYLEAKRSIWYLAEHHDFRPELFPSPLGTRVQYSVWDGEYRVLGMAIDLFVDRAGKIKELQKLYQPVGRFDRERNAALSLASIQQLQKNRFEIDSASFQEAPLLVVTPGAEEAQLAYSISVRENGSRFSHTVLVRAADGQMIGRNRPRKEF